VVSAQRNTAKQANTPRMLKSVSSGPHIRVGVTSECVAPPGRGLWVGAPREGATHIFSAHPHTPHPRRPTVIHYIWVRRPAKDGPWSRVILIGRARLASGTKNAPEHSHRSAPQMKYTKKEKRVDVAAPPLPEESAMAGPAPKFGQALASNDKEVRDKAVKALERYLRRAHDIEDLELRKIWKALFYCFWHSDKRKVQEDLAERMGALVHAMPEGKAWPFLVAFWSTMTREWTRIDRLRLDKFYMLMRCSIAHALQRVARTGWDETEAAGFAAVIGGPGGPVHPGAPVGVRYFMSDYFMPVLGEQLGRGDGQGGGPPKGALLELLEPFVSLMGAAEDDVMLRRVVGGVVQPVLSARSANTGGGGGGGGGGGDDDDDDDDDNDDDDDDDDDEPAPPPPLRLPFALEELSDRLFKLASAKSTLERNRKLLYALQKRVEALAATRTAEMAQAPASSKRARGAKAPPQQKAGPAQGVGNGTGGVKTKRGRKEEETEEGLQPVPNATELAALRSMLHMPKKKGAKAAAEQGSRKRAGDAAVEVEEQEEEDAALLTGTTKGAAAVVATKKAKAAAKAPTVGADAEPPEVAAAAPFIKSARFGGARKGYVFKRGAKGVGYYMDAPPVASIAPVSSRSTTPRGGRKASTKRQRT
jgi:ribosomal RNA-processing protein 1